MKNLKTGLTIAAFFIAALSYANGIAIKGEIKDKSNGDPLPFVSITVKGESSGTVSDVDGLYKITVPNENAILVFRMVGYQPVEKKVGKKRSINVKMEVSVTLDEVMVYEELEYAPAMNKEKFSRIMYGNASIQQYGNTEPTPHNTEEYDVINENIFLDPLNHPLSTFSIDVDAASYSNMRRMINNGQLPQKDVVRIEEMINYFNYDYPNPVGKVPFSITTEVSQAPWNTKNKLVHIGLQGKMLDYENLQATNLVFLIDVSGSMGNANKLPLLKSSMKLLVDQLGDNDRVAIVVYAGAAGLVLPSTPATDKNAIFAALNNLQAGGSTAGGAGIKLAYKIAKENLIEGGNNRVILATDGDFNVGASSTSDMVRLIEEKRDEGIFLTITGFGMGNYKDGRMEQISNAGNGNYYYIDNIKEAKKIFVTEMRATLFTIAKDVKIQVEFNPDKVQAYRLIGYENRLLKDEDFNDDKKDAGELGAGHTVTALYEIIPVGVESEFIKDVDPLKYQKTKRTSISNTGELLTVKFRYKKPDGNTSKLITKVLIDKEIALDKTSENFRFSAAVAELGMILRNSEFKANSSYAQVLGLASGATGSDKEGYRREFIQLTEACNLLSSNENKYSIRE